MKYVQGYVKVILFQNKENGYSVIKVRITESTDELYDRDELLTVTGYFPMLNTNELYRFFGETKDHPKYGIQYHANEYEKKIADGKEGIVKYLSSDLFYGVGPKLAEKIYDELGENCLDIIQKDASVLQKVGINPRKQKDIHDALMQNQGIKQILVGLYDFGFSAKLSMTIYNKYYNRSLEMIQENPYQLIEDIDGITFRRADEIGSKLGFSPNNKSRLQALSYELAYQYSLNGDTYILQDELTHLMMKNVNIHEFLIDEDEAYSYISSNDKLVLIDEYVMIEDLYNAEVGIAENLTRFNVKTDKRKEVDVAVEFAQTQLNIDYSDMQQKAIESVLTNPVTVITGGPGTGKTTVVNGVIEAYMQMYEVYDNKKIALVAPTGRAAKRMAETTGLGAKTIHSFLGYDFEGNFTYNSENMLNPKLIIIDEASMIDTMLMYHLLSSLKSSTRIVIVGDVDQLPSVGPGQVLSDLIHSEVLPVVELDFIYRQSEGSNLITLAHSIRNNEYNEELFHGDVSFIECATRDIPYLINQVITRANDKEYGVDNFQVLAPMYKGVAGIDRINVELQSTLNPAGKEFDHYGRLFRVNDKVLQLQNQPQDNIMNGDVGRIVGVGEKIVVDFDDNEVTYNKGELNNLRHAYCISIHKSQGNEYPMVILPISKSYNIMLKRKLIYTAVTRAKKHLVIIGEKAAFQYGVERLEKERNTLLKTHLEALYG